MTVHEPRNEGHVGLRFSDARLQHVFATAAPRYATVEEYAHAAGMSPDEVVDTLAPLVASGLIGLDAVQGRFFVHTAPRGRPAPLNAPQARPNLWELLRDRAPLERAFGLWRLLRDLEAGGWRVEVDQAVLELAAPVDRTWLLCGVWVGDVCVPLVPYPAPGDLGRILELFAAAGAHGVACTVPLRGLDGAVTAVRDWVLGRPDPAPLTVFVLEAPSFGATLVRPDDNSVTPVVVQRYRSDAPPEL